MKRFDCVEYEQEGPISIIRMNNPERRNSLNFQMRRGLNSAYGLFEEDVQEAFRAFAEKRKTVWRSGELLITFC